MSMTGSISPADQQTIDRSVSGVGQLGADQRSADHAWTAPFVLLLYQVRAGIRAKNLDWQECASLDYLFIGLWVDLTQPSNALHSS